MTTKDKEVKADEQAAQESERESLERAKEAGDLTEAEEKRLAELTESEDDDDSSSKTVVG